MKDKKKCVLAFSGGLDTTYCAKYLSNSMDMDVYSVLVNLGGFNSNEIMEIENHAYSLGVVQHKTIDRTNEFYLKGIKYLLFGNVLKNGTYPLSVSAERVFQAMAIAQFVNKIGADCVAHGSTGAGNDQVRFDLVFQTQCPEVEIITPIRDQKLSRQDEIAYLESQGIHQSWQKLKYSINKGIWGTSVGGAETLTSRFSLPETAWPTQVTKSGSEEIEIHFRNGEVTGLNELDLGPIETIKMLHKIAAPYGIGRDIHVGDTIIGIKGRVGFEAAATLILIKAHHLLEKHVLSKWQLHWKQQLGDWYGMMLHEGQYFDPVMRNIEQFLDDSQKTVSGSVFVQLQPYRFELQGISSPHDLMQLQKGVYGEMNAGWTGEDVKGFTKILANGLSLTNQVTQTKKKI